MHLSLSPSSSLCVPLYDLQVGVVKVDCTSCKPSPVITTTRCPLSLSRLACLPWEAILITGGLHFALNQPGKLPSTCPRSVSMLFVFDSRAPVLDSSELVVNLMASMLDLTGYKLDFGAQVINVLCSHLPHFPHWS